MLFGYPLPQRPRRERHTFSSPSSLSASPSDSGYGSALSSATSPDRPAKEDGRSVVDLWMHCDGNQSDSDDPFRDSDQTTTLRHGASTLFTTSATFQASFGSLKKSSTLPTRSPRSRRALLTPLHAGSGSRLGRWGSPTAASRPAPGSLRHPDRFIPARPQAGELFERFKTSKAPHELTASEKLLRHSGFSEDPFSYRRRTVTPMANQHRSQARSEAAASRNRVGSVLGPLDQNSVDNIDRQVRDSAAWILGDAALGGTAVNNGRGQLVRSGTNARLFRTAFPTAKQRTEEELEKHRARLAAALGLDRAQRVLEVNLARHRDSNSKKERRNPPTQWNGTEWVNDGPVPKHQKPLGNRALPIAPFKVLDAPNLRDDFYCSVLAYSSTCRTLAVALGNLLYGWSETRGVQLLNAGTDADCHLTSVSFSSPEGCKAILAFGRSNGKLGLMSLYDDPDPASSRSCPSPRFEVVQPAPIACLCWKPACTLRPSKSWTHPGIPVKTEDLLVGDEAGHVYYYAVEWPERWEVERDNWTGQMTLLARITIHSQQICGLAWSPNGELFGTGGNDNICCLFETRKILERYLTTSDGKNKEQQVTVRRSAAVQAAASSEVSEAETQIQIPPSTPYPVKHLGPGDEKHRWAHGAAVKAIAFCPWQESLVATGGGSNDKCIHFFHTRSGAALASISVSAQVTSLIWSTTRREIAATFGYAQPEHPVRIAVFSWPECRQVAAIPWAGEHRALYAIPYPSGPEDRVRSSGSGHRARSRSRTAMEGCIMVASSDKSIKFHEVWAADRKATASKVGVLGGSEILEGLEGIDREGEVIR
ncbi:hypothetical protein VTK56DRAFT_4350 [Thermocarpiscus australiensis]